MTGLEGPITIARAAAIASSASGAGRAAAAPSNSTPSTGAAARARIKYSWSGHQRPAWRTRVRTRSSLIGSTRPGTPSDSRRTSSASVSRAPSASRAARCTHTARSRSPRLNHTSSPSSRSPSITSKVSPAQAPAALVDAVGQPVEDEVGIGGDVGAVDLDVVGGVGDDDELVADHVEHAAGELGPARPAGQDDYFAAGHSSSGRPVIRIPAWVL